MRRMSTRTLASAIQIVCLRLCVPLPLLRIYPGVNLGPLPVLPLPGPDLWPLRILPELRLSARPLPAFPLLSVQPFPDLGPVPVLTLLGHTLGAGRGIVTPGALFSPDISSPLVLPVPGPKFITT